MQYLNKIMFTGIIIYCFGALYSCNKSEKPGEEKPNIVFIFIDDLGYGDLSIYGNDKIGTPRIDKVAEEGIRFTQFYSNAPVCSPSRVAFITGSYPFRFGIHGVIGSKEKNEERRQAHYLDTTAPLLPRILQEKGYRTGHFGKWHMGGGRDINDVPYPTDYGFDKSLVGFEGIGDRILDNNHFLSDMSAKLGKGNILRTNKHRITEIYVDSALAFVKENRDLPFYISLFPGDVHDPFTPVEDSIQKYLPYARDREEAKFFAVLRETDRQIGRFLDSLQSIGAMDNTIVVISSDNGPTDWPRYYKDGGQPPSSQGRLRGRKWSLYEGGIREPLIVKWQGKIPKNKIDTTSIGMVMDLFPSFLSMAGLENPEKDRIDGQDISSAFYGNPLPNDRAVFWYFANQPRPGNEYFVSPEYATRKEKWKFLMEEDGPGVELYNLEKDPQESLNVAQENPELVDSLQQLLLSWKEENVVFQEREQDSQLKN